jgi:hypothetical protein
VGLGLVAAAAYLVLAGVSGSLSPFDRHPLLDGVAPAAPYRWVSPPPDLGNTNQSPLSGSGAVTIGSTGSSAAVVSTKDLQATVILPRALLAPAPGEASVAIRILPLAPSKPAQIPSGLALTGNVYLITAVAQPSGGAVTSLSGRVQVVLVYPLQLGVEQQTVVRSDDGRSWIALRTNLSVVAQQVHAESTRLGYFAVAVRTTPGGSPGAVSPRSSPGVVWIAVAAAVLVIVTGLLVWRRRRRIAARRRAPKRRPPPERRGKIGPWE